METKEWPLRPEDIDLPVQKNPPPRYAFLVQVVGAEKLWAPEIGVVIPPKIVEGDPKTEDIAPRNLEAGQEEGLVASPQAVPENSFSKVSVSFKFPGEIIPETGPEICEPVAPEPLPSPPDPPPVLTVEAQDALDDLSDSELPPPVPPPDPPVTKFGSIATKEFEVKSTYALWHKLLHEQMEIIVYWTSPSGAIRKPLGRVMVDLFPALALNGDTLEISGKLEKIPEPPVVEEKGKGKKGKKDKDKDKEKSKEKEKDRAEKPEKADKKSKKKKKDVSEEVVIEETLPLLLEDAVLKIVVSTSEPFWSETNRLHGVVMEISVRGVINLPPKVTEFGSKVGKSEKGEKVKGDKPEKPEKGSKGSKGDKGDKGDPFSYSLVANIPGFIGTYWWENVIGLLPEERADLERIKLEAGKVEKEAIERPPTPPEPEPDPEPGSKQEIWKEAERIAQENREAWEAGLKEAEAERQRLVEADEKKWELRNRLLCCEKSLTDEDELEFFADRVEEDPKPKVPEPTEKVLIRWPDASFATVKRFLPGNSALDLMAQIRVGSKFRGELARYLRPPTDFFDPNFEKYHGCFFLDLSGFLREGETCIEVEVPFEQFTLSGTDHGITFCQAPPKPAGKKAPKAVEDDEPLPVSVDPENVLPNNSWQASKAAVLVQVRTSRPMQPFWEPPPQPNMTLEEVIPARKNPHTVYDALKLATQNFGEFVETASSDLIDLYQKITNETAQKEESEDDHSLSPKSSRRRIETKGEIRKKMVKMLRKCGTWNDMVEEMRVRVLKVAAEKFREKRRAALDIGKFEFCNDLYITLTEVIYNTLKELMDKVKNPSNTTAPKRANKEEEDVKDVDRLRSLADEYEASEDYVNAYRCHQERLKGENMKRADLWFEFGCFCMRVRPKDHGKAEECWREALTLDRNHVLSQQALGCLMWHRGYLTQAEVLIRSAIDVPSMEDHMSWVIASQIYAAQGKMDNERSCLRRAETCYNEARNSYRTKFSPPHQLLSPRLQFPFSLAHLVHTTKKTSSVFIDPALFLLDIHLPKEAEIVLKLDSDIYSCTLDNKWCRARVSELNGDLKGAESFIKEALAIQKDHPVTWLLLGHLRFSFKSNFEPLPQALRSTLCKGAIDSYAKYHRYNGVTEDMYQYVYLEMGHAYFKLGELNEARKSYLRGCTIKPTMPSFWLAAGIAYFNMGDMKHAELALVEGNVLDVQNFQIWAYLTLVCLRMERDEEAESSFQQALKTNLDPDLLATIAEHFCTAGNFRDAETAFTESLKLKESATVRFCRAEMYFKCGKLLAAKNDYNVVIKLPDVSQVDHSVSISRLTELEDVVESPPVNRYPQNPNYEV